MIREAFFWDFRRFCFGTSGITVVWLGRGNRFGCELLDMNDGRTAQTLPDTLDETDADVQFRFI